MCVFVCVCVCVFAIVGAGNWKFQNDSFVSQGDEGIYWRIRVETLNEALLDEVVGFCLVLACFSWLFQWIVDRLHNGLILRVATLHAQSLASRGAEILLGAKLLFLGTIVIIIIIIIIITSSIHFHHRDHFVLRSGGSAKRNYEGNGAHCQRRSWCVRYPCNKGCRVQNITEVSLINVSQL